jgi:hypothetical protein
MNSPKIAVVTEMNPATSARLGAAGLIGPPMTSTDPRHSGNGTAVSRALEANAIAGVPGQFGPQRAGYGLPCAKCKTYYAADLTACPVCKTKDRVSPVLASVPEVAPTEELPDPMVLEEERERFLQEFQSQIEASGLVNASVHNCRLNENHQNSSEPATVCQSCYEQLQERMDLMEAALHIDLKEASQVVYDAVWADPSDPNKTYQNAAQALLLELRKRAGVKLVLGPLQRLPH